MNTERQIYDYFRGRGLSPQAAAAWTARRMHESGGRHDAFRANDQGEGSHAFGADQWGGSRLTGLVDFARRRGIEVPAGDFSSAPYVQSLGRYIPLPMQMDYAWSEMQGPERRHFDAVRAAPDLSSAVTAAMGYYRPRGWTERTPQMGLGFSDTVRRAERILAAYGDQPAASVSAPAPSVAGLPRHDESRPPIFSGIMGMRGFKDGGAVIANALRVAEKQTERSPTEQQVEAGNYAKGKFAWKGLTIAVENPKGSTRSGTDKGGKPWRVTMPSTYGYILGSEARDGDHVDCYVGPDHASEKVFVVDQVHAGTGKYDEPKCMLSYPSKEAALADYRKAFSDGKADQRIGAVTEISVADFKDWIRDGNTKKPMGNIKGGGASMPSNNDKRHPAIANALRVARRWTGGRVGYAEGGDVVVDAPPPLRPFETALSAFDPLGLAPSAPVVTVQQPVDTLTGNEKGLRVPVRDRLPRPTEDESLVGSILGGGPAWRAMRGPQAWGAARDVVRRRTGYAEGGDVVDMGLVPPLSNQGDDIGIDGLRLAPPLPSLSERMPEGLGLQPQSQAETDALQNDARSMAGLLEGAGIAPAHRALVAAREGRPLATAGNAATAMLPYRPLAGLAALGSTYGGALVADLAPTLSSSTAVAQDGPNAETVRSLTAQAATLQQQVEAARVRREAERRSGLGPRFDAADQEFRNLSSQLTGVNRMLAAEMEKGTPEYRQRAANQQEYDRAVRGAESALAEARRARIPPFRETNVGQLYEMTGGVTPAVAGFGASALARLVGRGRPEAVAEGVLAGAVTPNAPLVYDMLTQPTYNPERAMYSAYARDLPPEHPRRQEWTNYAQRLPEENPVRRQASDEFYDLWRAAERTGMGALEGLAAGFPGANLAEGGRWISDSIRSGLGRVPGRQSGTPQPLPTELRPLPGTVIDPPLAQLPAPAPAASPLASRLAPESAAPAASEPIVLIQRTDARGRDYHYHRRGATDADGNRIGGRRASARPKTKGDEGEDITGHKSGGMVKAALDIARRFMGGRAGYERGGTPKPLPINQGVQPIRPATGGPENLDYLRGLRDFYKLQAGTVHADGGVARADGGPVVAGPVVGKTGGRTDALPVSVKSGSFVIPADCVSALGEGNTLAGHEALDKLFGKQAVGHAAGGAAQPDVPILISDGEHVISPETVAQIGNGDMDAGHKALEKFVLKVRKDNVKALSKLPPPARD